PTTRDKIPLIIKTPFQEIMAWKTQIGVSKK
ncbi:hypothetical protein EZS27_037927, partial [termite gut metagenome]